MILKKAEIPAIPPDAESLKRLSVISYTLGETRKTRGIAGSALQFGQL